MLSIERQQQILIWLEQEETLRVLDISKRLEVSEMTVYPRFKTFNGSAESIENI